MLKSKDTDYVKFSENNRNVGFTLAEVLITLGIVGVVAAITLPIVITNVKERTNSERQANIAQKITQAMEQMRAHGKLNVQYASTDGFVDELQKYLKIEKRCNANNIADCWPKKTVTGNDEKIYTISDTQTREKLRLNAIANNNNVGLRLVDGTSIILSYDTNAKTIDIGDKVEGNSKNLPIGGGKTKEFPYTTSVTDSIDFVMDVNGAGGPNKEMTIENKSGDIRSFKLAKFGADCPSLVVTKGTKIKGLCAVNLGRYNKTKSTTVCQEIGMRLPNNSELDAIYAQKGDIAGIPTSGEYWSSSGRGKNFANGVYKSHYDYVVCGVLCVEN